LVLEGFDTQFNKRDYKAAERLWSPNNIQAIEAEAQSDVPMLRNRIFRLRSWPKQAHFRLWHKADTSDA